MEGMELSASEAAREVGKSVQTITRAIARGVLSAKRTEQGGYLIDPSELFRVYAPRKVEGSATPSMEHYATLENVNATGVLEVEVKMLREMLAREQDTVSDLRARLDQEGEERRRLSVLLTHQVESDPKGHFWSRLLGKRP